MLWLFIRKQPFSASHGLIKGRLEALKTTYSIAGLI
jgi:hypothetical protein